MRWNIEETPNRKLLVLDYSNDDETIISLSKMVCVSKKEYEAVPPYMYSDAMLDEGRFLVSAYIAGQHYKFFFATKEEQISLYNELKFLLP